MPDSSRKIAIGGLLSFLLLGLSGLAAAAEGGKAAGKKALDGAGKARFGHTVGLRRGVRPWPAEHDPAAQKTRIAVLVRDENGKPVPGAIVLFADGVPNLKPDTAPTERLKYAPFRRFVATDKEARAGSPPLYPGTYQVAALPPGGGLADAKGRIGSPAAAVVAVKDKTVEVALQLRRGGTLKGVAADPEKKPLPGVSLQLTGCGLVRYARAGAGGKFVFADLYPGTYVVRPQDRGGAPARFVTAKQEVQATVAAGRTVETTLTVRRTGALLVYLVHRGRGKTAPPAVTLRLRGAEEKTKLIPPGPALPPVPVIRVLRRGIEPPRTGAPTAVEDNTKKAGPAQKPALVRERTVIVPSARRVARFMILPPGRYNVFAETPAGCGWRVEPKRATVTVRGGRFARLNLALIAGGTAPVASKKGVCRVRVLDKLNHAPVQGIGFAVFAAPPGGGKGKRLAVATTKANGLTDDIALKPGQYLVRVTQTAGLEIEPAKTTLNISAGHTLEKVFTAAAAPADEF